MTFSGAPGTPNIHSFGSFLTEPFRVLIAVITADITLLVVFFVELGDDTRNGIISICCLVDAGDLFFRDDTSTLHGDLSLPTQSYRLVLVHAVLKVAEIVHFRWLKSQLLRA